MACNVDIPVVLYCTITLRPARFSLMPAGGPESVRYFVPIVHDSPDHSHTVTGP